MQRGFGDTQQNGNTCRRCLAFGFQALDLGFKLDFINLLFFQINAVAGRLNLNFLQHLANNHLNVLVIDGHALQTIHILNFVNQVIGQLLNTGNRQNIMRGRVTIDEIFTLLDDVAFLHRQMLGFRHQIFDRLLISGFRLDDDATLVFKVAAKLNLTGNLSNNRMVFRTASFKKLSYTRQTTGNIAG